ncbi:UvrD-helicase domain-containing protein [Cellulomonas marina]|nr:UvrD-helicase domain-containing protein [Cellulomonas marina]
MPAAPGLVADAAAARLTALEVADLLGQHPPTPEQRRVIEAPLAPALVVAGAGSGKTETMAGRVVWLVANGFVAPEEVLGLTFTRKAAGELALRVRQRLRQLRLALRAAGLEPAVPAGSGGAGGGTDGGGAGGSGAGGGGAVGLADLDRPVVSTYNAYAASVVADHAVRLGLEPTARLLGEASQWQLASETVEAWAGDLDTDRATSTVVRAVLALSGALDEHLLDPAVARAQVQALAAGLAATPPTAPTGKGRPRPLRKEALEVLQSLELRGRLLDLVADYRARKRRADAIDHGDQIALAARLAESFEPVAAGERARYRVVLLDEYQDTSYAQVRLLRALFGGGHAVTAVGDPHQSIYGWRGASAGGLARFPGEFPARASGATSASDVVAPGAGVPGGRVPGPLRPADVHPLSTSWRNDRAVLAVANAVAEPLRAGVRGLDLPVLVPRPGAGEGRVRALVAGTVEEEAAAVARHLRDLRAGTGAGTGVGTGNGTGAGAEDGRAPVTAAVLCRRRSQFPLLRRALLDAGVPVEVVGLGGLLSTPEVVDLVAALQVAHDPARGDAMVRLLTGAHVRLGAADLHALHEWARELAGRGAPAAPAALPTDTPTTGPAPTGPAPTGPSTTGAPVEADAADLRSLVDAVDELPPPRWTGPGGRRLTPVARERLAGLARLLRTLRQHTYLTVPELVAEAERLLGLDLEVAARGGTTPGLARAALDAFGDVAVEFTRTADQATLGAFLAWLETAEEVEDGLDAPVTPPDPRAVQLVTVHGAKGLEWDAVVVAGLLDGTLPKVKALGPEGPRDWGWARDPGALPAPLRGDRADLPTLDVVGAADAAELHARLDAYRQEAGLHELAEERRLMYVAVTRAREDLLLTAAWWGDGSRPRALSPFLTELLEAPEPLVELVHRAPEPEPDASNPREDLTAAVSWPADPFGGSPRREAVERAAQQVLVQADAAGPELADLTSGDAALDALIGRLLDERSRSAAPVAEVELPPHLSASALVRLEADAGRFARDLRRPVPVEPSPAARTGTEFHAWVEAYYGRATLVDVDDLPGADDDPAVDADQASLRAAFLATPWAARTPLAVEVDIETSVDGYVLRSRIDAVFPDTERLPGTESQHAGSGADRRVVVVDWKTGRPPTDAKARADRELQLAVYRLAWSRWTGTPVEDVRAAFCYVGEGLTVFPERLLGEDELVALLRRTGGEPGGADDAPVGGDEGGATRSAAGGAVGPGAGAGVSDG